MNETPFQKELKKQIQKTIRELRASGTVAMSMKNLMQVVRTPQYGLAGEPGGIISYSLLFCEVCESSRGIKSFLLE